MENDAHINGFQTLAGPRPAALAGFRTPNLRPHSHLSTRPPCHPNLRGLRYAHITVGMPGTSSSPVHSQAKGVTPSSYFHLLLRDLVENEVVSPDKAQRLMPLDEHTVENAITTRELMKLAVHVRGFFSGATQHEHLLADLQPPRQYPSYCHDCSADEADRPELHFYAV